VNKVKSNTLDIHVTLCFTDPMIACESEALNYQDDGSSARVLHIVDVENLVGTADFTEEESRAVAQTYEAIAYGGAINQIVFATSHHAAAAAWYSWPSNARRLLGSGPDGADLKLLAALEGVESRFEHVVIGSGDGIFAFAAARLQAAGCRVTVVTRRDALSARLRLAVRDIRFIDCAVAVVSSVVQGGEVA
jgi:hypothetical protein